MKLLGSEKGKNLVIIREEEPVKESSTFKVIYVHMAMLGVDSHVYCVINFL